ncbi:hypothetical protein BKA64DRAFT_710236 [Cadophora sp. MPI-SDFR-AT-0126]|nr:hypothetical protein BKA64DRAFT_710236 [Leotiomycetes sp. MPI-SDFR-AT-0126]
MASVHAPPISDTPHSTVEEKRFSITLFVGMLIGFWLSSVIFYLALIMLTDPPEVALLYLLFAALFFWAFNLVAMGQQISPLTTKAMGNLCTYLCVTGQLIAFALLVLVFQVKNPISYVVVMMWTFVVQWTIFTAVVISRYAKEEKTKDVESGIVSDVGDMELDATRQDSEDASTIFEDEERTRRACDCADNECEHQTLMYESKDREDMIFDSAREYQKEGLKNFRRENVEDSLGNMR